MDNRFDSNNEDALKDASLADGWQRYVIIGRTENGNVVRPVIDAEESYRLASN